MGLLHNQPFNSIYILGAVSFELLRVPICFLKYIIPFFRPNPKWTLKQAILVRIFSSIVYHVATIRIKTPLPLTPGPEKERFTIISAADSKYFKGPLLSNPDVKPTQIGASWYPAPLTETSQSKSTLTVVLHIHGGAYVLGDGRTRDSGYMCNKFLKYTGATHVFCPQYRLSSLPASKTSNPFPAAIQDSITAYIYLIKTLNIPPENIVLSGDSAGGNAAIAVLKYISEHGASLDIPAPKAAWLWSPWIQPSVATTWPALRDNLHHSTDYLPYPFTSWGAWAYAGPGGQKTLESPWISFLNQPFRTSVPLYVNAGGSEVLYFDDVKFVEQMRGVGNEVTLDVVENVPHDLLLVGRQIGFNDEATRAAERAGAWLKGLGN